MRIFALLILGILLASDHASAGIISSSTILDPTGNPAGSVSSISVASTGDDKVKDLSSTILSIDTPLPDRNQNEWREGASFEVQFGLAPYFGQTDNTINLSFTNGMSGRYQVNRVAVSLSANPDSLVSIDSISDSGWTLKNFARSSDELYYFYKADGTGNVEPGETGTLTLALTILDPGAPGTSFNLKFDFAGEEVPEPSSLLISGFGLGIFALGRRRRNRSRRA